ncbi:MAG: ribosome silencing factor [Bacteroidetes bacterium]|nr:ribosome silencing factor [Bacteroidota bacterium]
MNEPKPLKKQKRTTTADEAKKYAILAATASLNKKALDVKIMALKGVTDFADYFVVCTAESDTQVKAIADSVEVGLEQNGWRAWHVEGTQNMKWVLLDYVDVVVHVFHKDAREFYGLDRLWGDAPFETVTDTPAGLVFTPSSAE